MPADPCPSYEELAAVVVRQAERIDQLEAELAELRRQLGQNSRTSSKPPSSDSPFAKPAPRSLRRRSGRKPGGQSGHPGSTLAQVADPDEKLRHEPGRCGGCGADLVGAPEAGVERRQVFDLPPMTVRVTDPRCGKRVVRRTVPNPPCKGEDRVSGDSNDERPVLVRLRLREF